MRSAIFLGFSALLLPVQSDASGCIPVDYGDGFCDEYNNKETCDFDGGDCCESTCVDAYYKCSNFDCQDPCAKADYVGDDVCAPSLAPTLTIRPSPLPTLQPSTERRPSAEPSPLPTLLPSPLPSLTPLPSPLPTLTPSTTPTPIPTLSPIPTVEPTIVPTSSHAPSLGPSYLVPSPRPTLAPSVTPFPTVRTDAAVSTSSAFSNAIATAFDTTSGSGGSSSGGASSTKQEFTVTVTEDLTFESSAAFDIPPGASLSVRAQSSSQRIRLQRTNSTSSSSSSSRRSLRSASTTSTSVAVVAPSPAPLFVVTGNLELADLTITAASKQGGGAVAVYGINATFTAVRVTFDHCSSTHGHGGAVLLANSASSTWADVTVLHAFTFYGHGGGVAILNGSSLVFLQGDATFVNCTASRGDGGGVYLLSSSIASGADSVASSTSNKVAFRGCSCGGVGGGLAVLEDSSASLLYGVSFTSPTSWGEMAQALIGGGVAVAGGSSFVAYDFECNGLRSTNHSACLSVSDQGSSASIVRGSITRNFGSAAIDTAIVSVRDATLSLDGVIFAENDNEDNEVTQGGSGRIVAATRNSILTLTNCQFDSHYTTASSSTQSVGGSIWVGDGSSLWLNHVNASGSHNANGPGGFLAMSGGGVATLDHLRVMDNSATGAGGAVWLSGLTSATISNSLFSGNTAGYSGGGLHVEKSGLVQLTDTSFFNNTAGIALDSSDTLDSFILDSGEILGSGGGVSSGGGGGIFAQRCRFEHNRCRGSDNDPNLDGVEEWTYDNCLGSEVAAAEDAVLQSCNFLALGSTTTTTFQAASASSLIRGQRVALDGSFLAVDDDDNAGSSNANHVTYGVSLSVDSSLSGSQTGSSSYALLSRNTPQLVNLGFVSDVNAYELSTCSGDWEAMNDGNPFDLRSFGVDYAPACPLDATCQWANQSTTLACTCSQDGAYVADLYQGFAECSGTPGPTLSPFPTSKPSRAPSRGPSQLPTRVPSPVPTFLPTLDARNWFEKLLPSSNDAQAIVLLKAASRDNPIALAAISLTAILVLGYCFLRCCCTGIVLELLDENVGWCWLFMFHHQEQKQMNARLTDLRQQRLKDWEQERLRRKLLGLGPRGGGAYNNTFGGNAGGRRWNRNSGSASSSSSSILASLHTSSSILAQQAASFIDSGRLPAAHELLAQSLDRKPGDIDLLFQLGRAYEQGADYEMALQLGYGKVLMMEPTDCAALAKSGVCHEELGNDRKAIDQYRTALKLLREVGEAKTEKETKKAKKAREKKERKEKKERETKEKAGNEEGEDGDKKDEGEDSSDSSSSSSSSEEEEEDDEDEDKLNQSTSKNAQLTVVQVKALAKYTLFNLGRCFEGASYYQEATATYTQLVSISEKELDELNNLDVHEFRQKAKNSSDKNSRGNGRSSNTSSSNGIELTRQRKQRQRRNDDALDDSNSSEEEKNNSDRSSSDSGSDVELALGKSADEREELETAERLMLAYKRDKEIEVKNDLGEALYHLARLHAKRKDPQSSAQALQKLVDLTLLQPSANLRNGQRIDPSALENMKKLALALAECGGEANFNRAAALFQEHILLGQEEDEVSDPRNYFELGRILQKNQKADEAIDIYKKCLSLDPLYPNALTNLGLAYESVGNWLEAEKAYKRSMKVSPRDEETLELLARCHLARGKHRDAVTAFTKLRDLLPEDLEVQRQLSRALRKGGNVEAALDTLEKLLDEDPDYLPGLVDYAWLLEKTLSFDDALAAYADALALVESDADPRPRHAIVMAVKRCEHARDKVASKGKAAGLNDLEALMSEEALREIMEGDDSFENLFSNSGKRNNNSSSSNGGLLATLGEEDEEDDDDDEEGVAGTGRLRWGSNEVMRSEDVDERVSKEVGSRSGDDSDDDDENNRSKKPSCKGGHGLKSYTTPTDALKCDKCKAKMAKGADFYGCKPCVVTVCVACFTAGGGEVEREANCAGQHGLRPYKVLGDHFQCQGCATYMPRGTPLRGCKTCDYNLCIVCFEVPPDNVATSEKGKGCDADNAKANCPGKHGLRSYEAPNDSISCGSCSNLIAKSENMYGCKTCRTTLCQRCYDNPAHASRPTCPGKHGLRPYSAPNDAMACDTCKKGLKKGDGMHGCKQCQVTICASCFAAPTSPSVNCPGKHGLRTYNAPNDTMACDTCKKGLKKGDGMHGCKQCQVTICRDCFKASAIQSSNEANCPGKHGLRTYNAPNDTMACDTCNKGLKKGDGMHGCKQCQVTICRDCFKVSAVQSSSEANCPGKHGLRTYNAPNDTMACDTCKRGLKKGDGMHGCKQCQVTICRDCFKASAVQNSGGANCPGKHGLRTYTAPNDSMACDTCKKGLKKGDGMHGCKQCQVTMCRDCFKAARSTSTVSKNCPGYHGLRIYTAPNDSMACDVCKTGLKKGDGMHGCKKCQFTMCRSCFETPLVEGTIEANCPGKHGLRTYTAPNDSMKCDTCEKGLKKGDGMHSCKKCQVTMCRDCFKTPKKTPLETANCPGKHGLRTYNAPNDTMSCDTCKKRLKKGDGMHGCKQCRVTICRDCYTSSPPTESVNCPEKCGLRKYTAPNDAMKCDFCSKSMAKGDAFRGCKKCSVTCCAECFSQGVQKESKSAFSILSPLSLLTSSSGHKERSESFDFDSIGGSAKTLREKREEREAGDDLVEEKPSFSLDPREMTGLGDLFGAQVKPKKEEERTTNGRICRGKHGLRPYKTPNASIACNACKTKLGRAVDFKGCKICGESFCLACAAQVPLQIEERNCSGRHGLRPYNAPNDSMECGSCKSRMKKDDPFRGCKKCSEYYCAACASTPDNASEKERNTSSFFDSASTSLLGGGAGSSEHKESESRNCSGHHGLQPYNAPNDSMECGSCKSRMKKDDPFRGCKKCSEYYCAACASTPDNASEKERNTRSFFENTSRSLGGGSSEHKETEESRNCSGQHGLRPYNAPNDSMECGGCKSRMKKGDPFRGCKKCSEYYCAACASTPDNASEKERSPSSFFESASRSLGGGSSEHKETEESRNCSGQHGLRPYNAPNDSMECGGCKSRMKKGDPFRGCKKCSEYYCAACASTSDNTSEKERNASSFEPLFTSPPSTLDQDISDSTASSRMSSNEPALNDGTESVSIARKDSNASDSGIKNVNDDSLTAAEKAKLEKREKKRLVFEEKERKKQEAAEAAEQLKREKEEKKRLELEEKERKKQEAAEAIEKAKLEKEEKKRLELEEEERKKQEAAEAAEKAKREKEEKKRLELEEKERQKREASEKLRLENVEKERLEAEEIERKKSSAEESGKALLKDSTAVNYPATAVGVSNCSGTHGLKIYQAPSDKMKCSSCSRKLLKGDTFYGCKPCKATICKACFSEPVSDTASVPATISAAAMVAKCTHGGLKTYQSPSDKLACGSCALRLPKGTDFFGCKLCKSTLCATCFEREDSVQETETVSKNMSEESKQGREADKATHSTKDDSSMESEKAEQLKLDAENAAEKTMRAKEEKKRLELEEKERKKQEAAEAAEQLQREKEEKKRLELEEKERKKHEAAEAAEKLKREKEEKKRLEDEEKERKKQETAEKAKHELEVIKRLEAEDKERKKQEAAEAAEKLRLEKEEIKRLQLEEKERKKQEAAEAAEKLKREKDKAQVEVDERERIKEEAAKSTPQKAVADGGTSNCSGLHGLKNYQAPSDKMKCSACSSKLSKGDTFYGCKPCKSTICRSCYSGPATSTSDPGSATSPRSSNSSSLPPVVPKSASNTSARENVLCEHGHKSYQAPSDKMKCSACSIKLAKGDTFYGCKPCKATICKGCYAGSNGSAVVTGNAASFRPSASSSPSPASSSSAPRPSNAGSKLCEHGHKSYQAPSDKMKCSKCAQAMAKGDTFYGCKLCKSSVCTTCYDRHSSST